MKIENKYCQKCKLHSNLKYPALLGRGETSPDILVMSVHPIIHSCETGDAWSSKAEVFVERAVTQAGLTAYYTYANRCVPLTLNDKGTRYIVRNATNTERNICKTFTVKLIRELRPKVVVCLGSVPMKQLLDNTLALEVARQKVYYHPELNVYIITTWDTLSIVGDDTLYKKQVLEDIDLAYRLCHRPVARKIKAQPVHLEDDFDINQYLLKLKEAEIFSFDLETTGLNAYKDRITDISFCCESGKGVHIDWAHMLDHMSLLQEVMQGPAKKIGHNGAFDCLFLHTHNIEVENYYFDTMIAYHTTTMSYEGSKSRALYQLKMMAWYFTTEGGYQTELGSGGIVAAQQSRNKKQATVEQESLFSDEELAVNYSELDYLDKELDDHNGYIAKIKSEKVKALGISGVPYYSAMDSDVTFRTYNILKHDIDTNYRELYHGLIMPWHRILRKMSQHGVLLDVPYMQKVREENLAQIEIIKYEFFKDIGFEFNIDSNNELTDFMYKKLGIKKDPEFVTDTGQPSTDIKALAHFSVDFPVLDYIIKYRNLTKQVSTYIDGFWEVMDDNHRIHPAFPQSNTATGRLASSSPNMQNLPRDNKIRNMIIPRPGYKILSADLSQAELRILAMLANDANMRGAFESGHDFHIYTACSMFGIPLDQFDKHNKEHAEKRTAAKAINFGVVFQMSARSLQTNMKQNYGVIISQEEAELFIAKFYEAYPQVGEWTAATKVQAGKDGYVDTFFGRRRYLPEIFSSIPWVKAAAERRAVNTPVQSTASDCAGYGLINIDKFITENNIPAAPIATIHDDILIECREDYAEMLRDHMVELMTAKVPKITIPLKADPNIFDRWAKV